MATKSKATLISSNPDERWRIERDLETLIEAEKIEKDPKRMAKVSALAKERMLSLAGVAAEAKAA